MKILFDTAMFGTACFLVGVAVGMILLSVIILKKDFREVNKEI